MKTRLLPLFVIVLTATASGCMGLMGPGGYSPLNEYVDYGVGGGGALASFQESRLQRMQARVNARKAYMETLRGGGAGGPYSSQAMGQYSGGYGGEIIDGGMMYGDMGGYMESGECSSCGNSGFEDQMYSGQIMPQMDPGFQGQGFGPQGFQSQSMYQDFSEQQGLQNAPMPPQHGQNLTPTLAPQDRGAGSEYMDAPQTRYTPYDSQNRGIIQTGMSQPAQYGPSHVIQSGYTSQPTYGGSMIPSQPMHVPAINAF